MKGFGPLGLFELFPWAMEVVWPPHTGRRGG
jgi:hypothetical protein